MNYFSIKNRWNRSTMRWTESTAAGPRVHGPSLNVNHSSSDLRLGLNEPKGYSTLLILAVDAGMNDPWRLHRQGRRAWPTVAAHRSMPLPALRSTKYDKVFTYGIGATWGTRLAHLGLTTGDGSTPCSSPRVNVQWLQGFSGLQNRRAAVMIAP
jgi:hypothetical protein